MKNVELKKNTFGEQLKDSRIRMGGRLKLGEFLVQAGVVDSHGIERALAVQRTQGGRLGSILTSLKLCKDEDIRKALGEQLGVEVVNLETVQADPGLVSLLSVDLIRKYEVLPLKQDGRKLWIAMMDPYNLIALEDIRFRTGIPHLIVTACTEQDFKHFIEDHLETKALFDEIFNSREFFSRAIRYLQDHDLPEASEDEVTAEQAHELRLASTESPIVTLCNFLVAEAIRRRASDIHLEPHETSFRVRMRVDGRLQTILNPPRRLHPAVTARFKVMSELDITKRRIPQDGHLAVVYHGETIHFRVSTLPTIYGEKCVIRLLRKNEGLIDFKHLGLDPLSSKVYQKALHAPQGLILVTGPTGSGKTTTLHAGLAAINHPEINIVTLEDPVESTLAGINHVPVSKIGGVSFAAALRSVLRQDPDVIFVGEIRDSEVATTVFRAAQTGHLVLSTLHTNSAVESIIRLIDLGTPSYLIAGSLLLVVAQRLLRRICDHCAIPYSPSDEELFSLGLARGSLAEGKLRTGKGCANCMETGYRGRVAVYEMIRMNTEMRELIHRQANSQELRDYAKASGTKSLFEAALEKVLDGQTTLSEMQRVLSLENLED